MEFENVRTAIMRHKLDAIKRAEERVWQKQTQYGSMAAVYVPPPRRRPFWMCCYPLVWTLFYCLILVLMQAMVFVYINRRCEHFGGRKCVFPFDLLPEWIYRMDHEIAF